MEPLLQGINPVQDLLLEIRLEPQGLRQLRQQGTRDLLPWLGPPYLVLLEHLRKKA
jgi:hypothetical protein